MARDAVDPSLEAEGEPSMVRTPRSMTTVLTWCVGMPHTSHVPDAAMGRLAPFALFAKIEWCPSWTCEVSDADWRIFADWPDEA